MKKLTNEDYQSVMSYVRKEPEFNLFFIGDLEIYGMESEGVSIYTSDTADGIHFPYLILDYRSNYLIYSQNPDFPVDEIVPFLSGMDMKNLSGKKELIERLVPHLQGLELVPTYMARLNEVQQPPKKDFSGHRLTGADVPAILDLLLQIDEFFTMRTKTREENHADILESLSHGGRMYGVWEDGILAAVAGTSAENSMAAMVVSVATLPQFRGRGYATGLVSRLCMDCLDEGMKFLCLFYNNPEAGAIYRRLGFQELGQYAMVKSIEK